jgi:hypothetical protein
MSFAINSALFVTAAAPRAGARRHTGVGGVPGRLGGRMRLPEISLRYCVSHPAATTVIGGMRSSRDVDANVKAFRRARRPSKISRPCAAIAR